jgi:hypothetical protein
LHLGSIIMIAQYYAWTLMEKSLYAVQADIMLTASQAPSKLWDRQCNCPCVSCAVSGPRAIWARRDVARHELGQIRLT